MGIQFSSDVKHVKIRDLIVDVKHHSNRPWFVRGISMRSSNILTSDGAL